MFKNDEKKEIEQLAKEISKKDKRLSWPTCLRMAKSQKRLFGH